MIYFSFVNVSDSLGPSSEHNIIVLILSSMLQVTILQELTTLQVLRTLQVLTTLQVPPKYANFFKDIFGLLRGGVVPPTPLKKIT